MQTHIFIITQIGSQLFKSIHQQDENHGLLVRIESRIHVKMYSYKKYV